MPRVLKPLPCDSKRRYPDEALARAVAMHSLEERPGVRALYVYRCPDCRGWHLTRSDNGREAKVTIDQPVHTTVRTAR